MLGRIASKAAKKLIGVKKKKKKAPDPRILDHSENLKILKNRKAADSARKVEGKNTADLTQPAGGSAGQTMDQADAGIRSSQRAARKATDFDKAIKKKKTALNKYQKKRDSLKGKDKIKFIHENQQRIKDLKASIADMERRGGPRGNRKTGGQVVKKYKKGKQVAAADWMQGLSAKEIKQILGSPETDAEGVTRHTKRKKINKPKKKKVSIRTAKTGGQVMKKAAGGKMSHVGLYPQEEGRKTGVLPQAKRKRYARGGKVEHNTSRMNELEELGRVDAEHAHTPKGKRNLRAEKKRVIAEIKDGNKFVAHFYDS